MVKPTGKEAQTDSLSERTLPLGRADVLRDLGNLLL